MARGLTNGHIVTEAGWTHRLAPCNSLRSTMTRLEWDDLRFVLAIAESGTLSGAAASIGVSHPTLSRRLRRIEERLGTRLFDRTPPRFRITPAGEEMRLLAMRVRVDIGDLERRIGDMDSGADGTVRLTAPDAVAEYLLTDLLAELSRELVGLTIDLLISNDVLSLAQRSADLALRIAASPSESLVGRRIGTVAFAIYAATDPSESGTDGQSCGAPWVGFDSELACTELGRWVAANVVETDIRLRANTLVGAAHAVRSGIGRGLLPCFVGESIPNLRRVGAPLPELSSPLWLLAHADIAPVPRVRRASAALGAKLARSAPLLAGAG